MPFVLGKCPNCGGMLAVDNAKDSAVCPFCNTPYISEKAISQYHVHANVGAGAVVNVTGNANSGFEIVAGTLKKYVGKSNNVVIPDSVTSIGDSAFKGLRSLTSVTIPDSVTSIGWGAFRGCSGLKSVTIGNGVTSIGWGAFDYCIGLTSVYITDLVKWCGISFESYNSNPLNDTRFYGKNLYLNNTLITDLVIPDCVTSIGKAAFIGCTGLTSVTIPDSVTSIGEDAFSNCSGLMSVTIGNGVTSIGEAAFSGCTGLKSVTIPNSVTSIGWLAFRGCTGLKSVTIGNGVTSIDLASFVGCENIVSVVKPQRIADLYFSSSKWYRNKLANPKTSANINTRSSGCYVATAVYGSYDCPQVWTLRRYRDERLAATRYGRAFIRTYYAISPTIVKWFGHTDWFKKMWRGKLDRMVSDLNSQGVEDTPYKDKEW